MRKQNSGWKGESRRHSLARKGVKTTNPKIKALGKKKIEENWRDPEWIAHVNNVIQQQIDKGMKVFGISATYYQDVYFEGLAKSQRGMKQKIGNDDVMDHADEIDWNRSDLLHWEVEENGIPFEELDREHQIKVLKANLLL